MTYNVFSGTLNPTHSLTLSGSTLVSINKVTICRTQLVLGWVTLCGRVNHLGLGPATQANLAFYPQWDGKMSTGQSVVMLCGWGVKAHIVYSTGGEMCGWQVKLIPC